MAVMQQPDTPSQPKQQAHDQPLHQTTLTKLQSPPRPSAAWRTQLWSGLHASDISAEDDPLLTQQPFTPRRARLSCSSIWDQLSPSLSQQPSTVTHTPSATPTKTHTPSAPTTANTTPATPSAPIVTRPLSILSLSPGARDAIRTSHALLQTAQQLTSRHSSPATRHNNTRLQQRRSLLLTQSSHAQTFSTHGQTPPSHQQQQQGQHSQQALHSHIGLLVAAAVDPIIERAKLMTQVLEQMRMEGVLRAGGVVQQQQPEGATHKKAPQQAHISPLPPTPTKQKIKSATPASFTANSALSTPVYAAANDSSRMPPRSKRGAQSTSGWRSARGSTAVTPRYAAGTSPHPSHRSPSWREQVGWDGASMTATPTAAKRRLDFGPSVPYGGQASAAKALEQTTFAGKSEQQQQHSQEQQEERPTTTPTSTPTRSHFSSKLAAMRPPSLRLKVGGTPPYAATGAAAARRKYGSKREGQLARSLDSAAAEAGSESVMRYSFAGPSFMAPTKSASIKQKAVHPAALPSYRGRKASMVRQALNVVPCAPIAALSKA